MVTICQMSQIKYGTYDEVWAIVRSLKYSEPRVRNIIRHVPELSPSWGLFKKYLRLREEGNWNEETFRTQYVPQFLREMRGKEQQRLLNELFMMNKHICLVCFCSEEELCHRSIIGGMLQGAGLDVKGLTRDYSFYFDWWKNGVPGIEDKPLLPGEPEKGKRVKDHNPNVTYLYNQESSDARLFDDNVPTMFFTGRRPKDLCGYHTERYNGFVSDLADMLHTEFYAKRGIRRYITGGAQGFDQLSFWAVQKMKSKYGCSDIQNIVFVPFEQQEVRWAENGCFSQVEYWQMIKCADRIVVVCKDNDIESLFVRNHAMCDVSDYGLGLYPDDNWRMSKGGTAECLRYAAKSSTKTFRLGYDIDTNGLHIGKMTDLCTV